MSDYWGFNHVILFISAVLREKQLNTCLYALFIRLFYDLEKLTTFADDNYVIGYHKEKDIALGELGEKLAKIVEWLKDSGL